jgi:hypothetical protein
VSLVRPAIVPPLGQSLAVVDYSAIEARVVLWLAEDEKHLEWYRKLRRRHGPCALLPDGRADLWPPRSIRTKDEMEYAVGKQTVLGCGFQMGAPKFKITCDNFGIDLGRGQGHRGASRKDYRLSSRPWPVAGSTASPLASGGGSRQLRSTR